ncbi:hypothetical protein JW898_04255 [Candidatus Woesearchaeota archaeon]|nr:hypothetical protein [Candidatus Woesearchaeota archaeon]
MKTANLIGIIVMLSFLLAISGCGGKEAEPVPVPAEEVAEAAAEPELPEEGVHEAGPDVTEEVVSPDGADDAAEETVEEVEDSPEDVETSDSGLTAENYRVISLKDLKAYPEEMNIKVGTTVEWRNVNDNLQHIIGWKGQKQEGITPEPMLAGESWSYTFSTPGKVVWFSTARPTIQGTIYVEE